MKVTNVQPITGLLKGASAAIAEAARTQDQRDDGDAPSSAPTPTPTDAAGQAASAVARAIFGDDEIAHTAHSDGLARVVSTHLEGLRNRLTDVDVKLAELLGEKNDIARAMSAGDAALRALTAGRGH